MNTEQSQEQSNMSATISKETPLFLQEGGEEKINNLRKELQVFLNLLNANPHAILDKTYITLNPHTLNPLEVGQEEADAIRAWWLNQDTKVAIHELFLNRKHKLAGEKVKEGDWCCGFLGSRWCDITLNGRRCRLAFFTKTTSPSAFSKDREGRSYAISIDPTN